MENKKWWKERVIYQIYPMSFCDSNGDGIGDINGIISKLDYLKQLGVGALWLSPVYKSPNHDNGYDISDYCDIHENLGTLEDIDRLIAESEKRDIKIIMDLVINHTSDQHEWFQKSRQKIEPYTDYYIWRKGENGKKPNNWTSFFGEDCWEYDELRGEYFLHLFAKQQPDLNYHNEDVIKSVIEVMRFWLERGVAGFRCDVINILYKQSLENGKKSVALTGLEHYHSNEGTHRILNRLNKEVLSKYDGFTVGETVFVTPQKAKDLVDPKRQELDTVFSFEHMETDCFYVKWLLRKFSPNRFLNKLSYWQQQLDWNTVYFENHDQPRSVTRFGNDKDYFKQSAKALAILLLTLRGTPFIYEGQEIGMTNFDFNDISDVKDIESLNIWNLTKRLMFPKSLRWKMIKTKSRDNARTPMQWNSQPNAGFSTGDPWLKVNSNFKSINVQNQQDDETSVLGFYKRLISFRNQSDILKHGEYKEKNLDKSVLVYDRILGGNTLRIVVNLSNKKTASPIVGDVLFSSYEHSSLGRELKPYEAVIIDMNKNENTK